MSSKSINSISTRGQYDKLRSRLDEVIREATKLGVLEPGANNDLTKEIAQLAKLTAEYEEIFLNILPLRKKNPLILSIEQYIYTHNLKRKELAEELGITESVFSQIMNAKRKISIDLAKKIYEKLNIDPAIILTYA